MKNITALVILFFTPFLYPSISYAITMGNGSYQINSSINYSPQEIQGKTNIQENTKAQNSSRSSSGENYSISYGFENIPITKYFAIKNSNSEISFGEITPGEALERSTTIDVMPGGSKGFQLFTVENHALMDVEKKTSIPDTTCDNGNCTKTLTDSWKSPLTYGFGFRCDNNKGFLCSNVFSDSNSYRKLPNIELGDVAESFVATNNSLPVQIKTTFRVNVSGSQPQGSYQNNVLVLASPTL